MAALARLCPEPVWSFRPDGTVMDLAAPDVAEVDFCELAERLSKLARFNAVPRGPAYSVAQHSVMGAQALLNEKAGEHAAALFLLHDGHEWALGDLVTPFAKLIDRRLQTTVASGQFKLVLDEIKDGWDEAIYKAARLPGPRHWSAKHKQLISAMDARMCAAEALALFGPSSSSQFPKSALPKLTGAIRAWAPMKAEEEFMRLARHLLTEDVIYTQRALVAANRSTR